MSTNEMHARSVLEHVFRVFAAEGKQVFTAREIRNKVSGWHGDAIDMVDIEDGLVQAVQRGALTRCYAIVSAGDESVIGNAASMEEIQARYTEDGRRVVTQGPQVQVPAQFRDEADIVVLVDSGYKFPEAEQAPA